MSERIDALARRTPPAATADPYAAFADEYDAISTPERRSVGGTIADRASRFGSGLMDPVIGAAQIADRAINPLRQMISPGASSMSDVVRERDAAYVAPEGVDWMRMAGNVANPISWAGGGATTVPRMVLGGAGQAMLAPTDATEGEGGFWLKKAVQAATGGALSGTLGVAGKGLVKATDSARKLIRQGIHVPPGAAAGGRLANLEEKLSSYPILGESIDAGRRRAAGDVQSAVIDRAMKPPKPQIPLPVVVSGKVPSRSVRGGNAAVSAMYDASVPHIRANPEGLMDAATAYNQALANPRLSADNAKILTGIWDENFVNYASKSGEDLKHLDSELGHIAREYSGRTASPSDKVLASEIYKVMAAMRGGWEKGMPKAEASVLNRANRAYKEMIPVNKASSARFDELATPRALQKAMAHQARKDVTRMPYDEIITPAVQTLTAHVPDSGTAGRSASMHPLKWLTGAVAGIPMSAAQSRSGAKWLLGETGWQQALDPYSNLAAQATIAGLRE